jgi:hypothetical protein
MESGHSRGGIGTWCISQIISTRYPMLAFPLCLTVCLPEKMESGSTWIYMVGVLTGRNSRRRSYICYRYAVFRTPKMFGFDFLIFIWPDDIYHGILELLILASIADR